MTQILFVQGAGDGAHDQWDNRLVDSLRDELGSDYEIRYPAMPNESDPTYASWKPALQRELAALRKGAIVVGHSVGGTILVNLLADETPPAGLRAICLIAAPFVGPGGWPSDEFQTRADLGACLPPGVPVFLYHGDADDTVPVAHVNLYAQAIPHARVRRLPGRDHQLGDRLSEVAMDIRSLDRDSQLQRGTT
jgi:predicted alpha/beta hydrolase family esterase